MNIIQATRAHYAALQHRPDPDRIAIDYEVIIGGNITRLNNRLRDMYPEAKMIHCRYRQ